MNRLCTPVKMRSTLNLRFPVAKLKMLGNGKVICLMDLNIFRFDATNRWMADAGEAKGLYFLHVWKLSPYRRGSVCLDIISQRNAILKLGFS